MVYSEDAGITAQSVPSWWRTWGSYRNGLGSPEEVACIRRNHHSVASPGPRAYRWAPLAFPANPIGGDQMTRRQRPSRPTAGDLSELLGGLHSGGGTSHEDFEAVLAELRRSVRLPVDAHVIGEPVVVLQVRYSGNIHRGLVATVRREDGSEHDVALGMFEKRGPRNGL